LVKKKIKGEELSYAVISTGNFNEITAVFYTDHVLMTSNKKIIHELSALLKFLEKGHNEIGDTKIKFEELLVSQFNLKEELEKYIHKEIKAAKNNIPARIRIKVNNLEEPGIIDLLYKASKAGVRVELIVRSVCCILPGIAGLSENIIVHRIVDRFLEHSRVFIFGEDDHASVFLGSADLMTRNLFHRIEVCVAVKDDKSKKELLDYFGLQWNDYDKFTLRDNDQPAITQSIANGCHKKAQENIYQYLKQRI
jgi:polyphosphate kinase